MTGETSTGTEREFRFMETATLGPSENGITVHFEWTLGKKSPSVEES